MIVFERSWSSSTLYVLVQKIVPFELLGGDQLGSSLAIEMSINPSDGVWETCMAVGAWLRYDYGIDSGAAYVYLRTKTPEAGLVGLVARGRDVRLRCHARWQDHRGDEETPRT